MSVRDKFEVAKRRADLKRRAVMHKGGRCQICGYDRCYAALEFHHPDGRDKDLTISAGASWEAICSELDRTVLLCTRCHREVHDGFHPAYLVHDDVDRGWVDGLEEDLEADH